MATCTFVNVHVHVTLDLRVSLAVKHHRLLFYVFTFLVAIQWSLSFTGLFVSLTELEYMPKILQKDLVVYHIHITALCNNSISLMVSVEPVVPGSEQTKYM